MSNDFLDNYGKMQILNSFTYSNELFLCDSKALEDYIETFLVSTLSIHNPLDYQFEGVWKIIDKKLYLCEIIMYHQDQVINLLETCHKEAMYSFIEDFSGSVTWYFTLCEMEITFVKGEYFLANIIGHKIDDIPEIQCMGLFETYCNEERIIRFMKNQKKDVNNEDFHDY